MRELKFLNKFLFKYRIKLIIGFFITVTARIFALIAPNLVGNSITLIENYILSSSIDLEVLKQRLIINILLIIGSALVAGVFTFIMRQMIINVSRFIEFDLKNIIYKKYQNLDFDFYKNNRTGDLMNRISEDVSKVRMYVGPAIMYTINTITLFVIVVSYMFSVAPKLTMYTLTPLPILSIIIYKISKIINIRSKIVQEYLSKLTTFTQEAFSGVKIIKTSTIEDFTNKKLERLAGDSKEKNMSLVKVQSWFFPLMILLIGISNILVIYIGGNQYMSGQIELGVLAEFIIYVNMLTWPVATVGWVTSIIQQAEASQKRINEFLNVPNKIINKKNSKLIVDGDITFNNVSYSYKETNIKALNKIYDKAKELDRKNQLLKAKYNNDEKYARLHKRLMEKDPLTDGESKLFDLLNGLKKEVDLKIEQNTQILENENYVNQMVTRLIIDEFNTKNNISLTADVAKNINTILVKEYMREYRGEAA